MSLRRILGLSASGALLLVASLVWLRTATREAEAQILPATLYAGTVAFGLAGCATRWLADTSPQAKPAGSTGPSSPMRWQPISVAGLPWAASTLLVSALAMAAVSSSVLAWSGLSLLALHTISELFLRFGRVNAVGHNVGHNIAEPPVPDEEEPLATLAADVTNGDETSSMSSWESATLDESLDQLISRSTQTADGDVLHALVRCRLAAGQRSASVHVGFLPPFAACPEVSVRSVDESAARITLGESVAWGARIDVRLPRRLPSSTSCVLELIAACAEQNDAA